MSRLRVVAASSWRRRNTQAPPCHSLARPTGRRGEPSVRARAAETKSGSRGLEGEGVASRADADEKHALRNTREGDGGVPQRRPALGTGALLKPFAPLRNARAGGQHASVERADWRDKPQ